MWKWNWNTFNSWERELSLKKLLYSVNLDWEENVDITYVCISEWSKHSLKNLTKKVNKMKSETMRIEIM